jgi:osomolarity two-component system, response regulator SKN7
MPKLDGVTATSLIRQFDDKTPIISMTSNSKPNEIMTYFSSGMNDILPKPFTKEGLLEMLEVNQTPLLKPPILTFKLQKHLVNFRQIREMGQMPRQIGPAGTIEEDGETVQPSVNPPLFATVAAPLPEDEGKIDPLLAMGLTDQKYNMILTTMVGLGATMGSVIASGSVASAGGSGSAGEKRSMTDDGESDREGKRPRFEVLE